MERCITTNIEQTQDQIGTVPAYLECGAQASAGGLGPMEVSGLHVFSVLFPPQIVWG